MQLPPYVVLEKAVGETPLSCAEAWRAAAGVDADVPLAYAGRLDPMASGKLLVLIGDECKRQTDYHNLDKAYDFWVLLGIGSDTHDVLGRLTVAADETSASPPSPHQATGQDSQKQHSPNPGAKRAVFESPGLEPAIKQIAAELEGNVDLPYPHFSAKTVQGLPLHTWTLQGRLDEIDIPTKQSTIYSLELTDIETMTRQDVATQARAKIDTIPPVTEARKALGNDFRRVDVRVDWQAIKQNDALPDTYHIAHFHCIASSGTYMRTLAHLIGQHLSPAIPSLAWHIHRTDVGVYDLHSEHWSLSFQPNPPAGEETTDVK